VAARFDLAMVRAGQAPVPRLFRARLPANLARLEAAGARKRAFIETLLPLLLQANYRVLADRERLLAALAHPADGRQLDSQDMDWLAKLAENFEVDLSKPSALAELKRRVDSVPPSLALAQAAEESGWGTSRFALKGNAVFGQRTWKKGGGIVPRRRDRGERHEVKVFANLRESVSAYLWNLNTHPAYAALRAERAKIRRRGARLGGYALAGTLIQYSERRARYVDTIRAIIRINRLDQFDTARLAAPHMAALGARLR
jgi:Bax protein